MKLVGDREVFETPLATSSTRFENDKYYLIANKTVDSSEDVRAKSCDVSWSQYRAGAARSILTYIRLFWVFVDWAISNMCALFSSQGQDKIQKTVLNVFMKCVAGLAF